jgi:protocatechuate 3,4-dioxygenase beta subunit
MRKLAVPLALMLVSTGAALFVSLWWISTAREPGPDDPGAPAASAPASGSAASADESLPEVPSPGKANAGSEASPKKGPEELPAEGEDGKAPGIRGRVTDRESGNPIAEASLEAEGLDEGLCGNLEDSREDGRYFLSLLEPGAFSVKAEHEDYVGKTAEIRVGKDEVAVLDFVLARKPSIRGTVRDPDGKPVAGATVWTTAMKINSLTDETGAFELERLPAGALRVFASSSRYPLAMRRVETREGGTAVVDFDLERGTPLAGRVISSDGKPVAGATVFASRSWTDYREVAADSDGRFRLEGLRPGETYSIRAAQEGFFQREDVALAGVESLEIVLEIPSYLEGRVLDAADGAPVPDPWVEVLSESGGEAAETLAQFRGGKGGTFRSSPMRAGRYRVRASAPGFVEAETSVTLSEKAVLAGIRILLGKGVPVSGCVLAADTRSPVAGAEVRSSNGKFARTDPEGRFTIGWFDPDTAREIGFLATHPEYAPATASVQVPPWDREILIPLSRGGRVSGLVRMSNGKPAVLVAELRAFRLEAGAGAAIRGLERFEERGGGSDEEGRFEIRGLEMGRHVLRVFPQGDGPCLCEREIVVESEGQELSCDLELRGAVLTGTVRAPDGKPAQGCYIGLVENGRVRRFREKDYCCWARGVEDDGSFLFPGLPPGRHRIGILPPNKQGPALAVKELVVERDGQELVWDVVLSEEED